MIGNLGELDTVASQHWKRLHGVAYSILRNHADAEDVVQSSLVLALLHSGQYAGQSTFLRWVTAITINEAITHIRRSRGSRGSAGNPIDSPAMFRAADPSPEEQAIARESMALVESALRKLPDEYASVFRLREFEWLSERETGERLGISTGCVKIRLFRARSLLRKHIAPRLRSPHKKPAPLCEPANTRRLPAEACLP